MKSTLPTLPKREGDKIEVNCFFVPLVMGNLYRLWEQRDKHQSKPAPNILIELFFIWIINVITQGSHL